MNYLSIDTEATGLEEGTHLIQFALVPVDMKAKAVVVAEGVEFLVKCPSFEELKPTLNPWVLEHNEGLIRKAHAEGVTHAALKAEVEKFLERPGVKAIFGKDKPVFLGKSLSALDIPLMTRTFGKPFMEKHFHHHTLDITSVAHYLVHKGIIPGGCESTSKLIKHFQVRSDAAHTALADATDMGNIFLKMVFTDK